MSNVLEKIADELVAEKIARMFHEAYERLAPEYGYETRKETGTFDKDSPNGKEDDLIEAIQAVFGDEE